MPTREKRAPHTGHTVDGVEPAAERAVAMAMAVSALQSVGGAIGDAPNVSYNTGRSAAGRTSCNCAARPPLACAIDI